MCRLYAFRANEPTKVECSLVYAQNALMTQSIVDSRGQPNADGWGIVSYENSVPILEKRDTAAHQDEYFSVSAEKIYARTVIAHVRQATIGNNSLPNSHPFVYGTWTFAHNGTLQGFPKLEPELAEETDADLLEHRRGETDSEMIFYWLLTRLRRVNGGDDMQENGFDQSMEVVADAMRTLDERAAATRPEHVTRLNVLLTNGRTLFGTRFRNSLYWLAREGIHDCEVCGIPHVQHQPHTRYHAILVASEPISHECWQEIEDGTVVGVDENLEVHWQSL